MPIVIGNKKKSSIQVIGKSNKPVDMGSPKGSAKWGKIIGDIHSQADLMDVLDTNRRLALKALKTAKAAL